MQLFTLFHTIVIIIVTETFRFCVIIIVILKIVGLF